MHMAIDKTESSSSSPYSSCLPGKAFFYPKYFPNDDLIVKGDALCVARIIKNFESSTICSCLFHILVHPCNGNNYFDLNGENNCKKYLYDDSTRNKAIWTVLRWLFAIAMLENGYRERSVSSPIKVVFRPRPNSEFRIHGLSASTTFHQIQMLYICTNSEPTSSLNLSKLRLLERASLSQISCCFSMCRAISLIWFFVWLFGLAMICANVRVVKVSVDVCKFWSC